jgi:hypothetical protein
VSSLGDQTQNPHVPGTTIIVQPEREDLAEHPNRKANSPENSPWPQLNIIDRQFLTERSVNTRSPVVGQTPPLASVPASMAMALQSSIVALDMKYISKVACASTPAGKHPCSFIRYVRQ